jgi:hypothetical protein
VLKNLQLTALVRDDEGDSVLRVPITAQLQAGLQNSWGTQFSNISNNIREIDFTPGYEVSEDEKFRISNFTLPSALSCGREATARLNSIDGTEESLKKIKALVVYAQDVQNVELILFQRFTKSHIVTPGSFLFIQNGTFETVNKPCLTLGNNIEAVYYPGSSKLIFSNFRFTNMFLPLMDLYREASESEIRQILNHRRLKAENADALAISPSQWLRTRFAMLRDSGILDRFEPRAVQQLAGGLGIIIRVETDGGDEKIVFPDNKAESRRLLQFLNEEIYKGAITDTIYETNSKREAGVT